jgi:hypothetical protein
MCQRITCRQCGKPTFAGCGRHVESVLGDVAPAQRCQGHTEEDAKPPGDEASSSALERFFAFLSCGARRQP